MRQPERSKFSGTYTRAWWALLTAAAMTLLGATWIAAQEWAVRPSQPAAARPFRKPPGLLSEAAVAHGLATRHRGMQERFLAHEERRRQRATDDYALAPALNLHARPRPDAPRGEFDTEGVR